MDSNILETIKDASKKEAAEILAPLLAPMVARRAASPDKALALLGKAIKSMLGARKRADGDATKWILKTLSAKRIGKPLGGAAPKDPAPLLTESTEALTERDDLNELVAGMFEGVSTDDLNALLLIMGEELTVKDASEIAGEHPAVMENNAARAFAATIDSLSK